MTDAAERADAPPSTARVKVRRDWRKRLAKELAALVVGLLLIAALALVLLDTAPGHRFLVDRLSQVETASGLRFRIGRIEGSIFGDARLKQVAVLDKKGVFLTSPEIRLDWAPGAWLYNALHIDRLHADRVVLRRLPETTPTGGDGPLLPDFDIHIGSLRIDRLVLLAPVTGKARTGTVRGSADVRAGRAMIDLKAMLDGGGDRLALRLDAEPGRDRFDLGARLVAPADGLVPAMTGLSRSIDLAITGDGRWSRWRGRGILDVAGRPTARLTLAADDGRYRLSGALAASRLLTGQAARLTAPTVKLSGEATFVDNLLDGRLLLGSAALRTAITGAVDLGEGAFRDVRIGVDLLRPSALFQGMAGRDIRLLLTLDGAYDRADFAYRLTAPLLRFDQTGFVDVRAQGQGRLSRWPVNVPIQLSARAITGAGDLAGAILANARIDGVLTVTPKLIRGDRLRLRSARVQGTIGLLVDLVSGRFELILSGGIARYAIPGLGIVDVQTDLRVVPGPGGKGSRIIGKARAVVRRLDNSFFRGLTRGLPRIETDLERGADGIIRFTNLQFYSPGLRLSGSGRRNRDGTFHIEASGRQADYGPLRLVLDGDISRPRVELFLQRPMDSLQLRDVRLSLNPTATGFAYRAAGQSRLGPFTSVGDILLPKQGQPVFAIAALDVAGTRASGRLMSQQGGFAGSLALAGGGLDGTLDFRPVDGAQRIEAHLALRNASLPGIAVRSGRVDGAILLADGRTTLEGTVDARGLEASGVSLARLTANARLVNGSGQVRAVLAGRRGAAFDFTALADVEPGRIAITGRGSVDGQPLVLLRPAVLTSQNDAWVLAPTTLSYGGGRATISGRSGDRPEIHAELRALPMRLLAIGWPGIGLGGQVNGRIDYAWKGTRSGRADLRIRNLSRAGLVLSSQPIDLALVAAISGNSAAVRAVAASDGKTVGRAQARFAPLGNGPIAAELLNAPLLAQLRYAGPADTLWRLSGTELFDLTGPISVGVDVAGRLVDPRIRGSVRSSAARLESAVTGTVIEGLQMQARFNGSRMIFDRIAGTTNGSGRVSGRGDVAFGGASIALNLDLDVDNALLLNRDDVAARVTGPVRIRSDGRGGLISGQLRLDSGRFTLGQAGAAASVPKLDVRHSNLDEDDVIEIAELEPWRFDLSVAGGDLEVRGLGIDSIWTTDLKIGGTVTSPRFTGRADLVRGQYEFAGRSFRLERGIIRFRGQNPPDPLLDIRAEAQVQGLDASVRVTGSGSRPEITFASVPSLPQDELLSRLLFGTSITNLSAAEALQLASAVAALQSGEGGIDPINQLRRAVGLDRLRILPADVATGQGTAIAAGKYINRKLFVEVITDGQGYSATRAEYQVTRWLSLLSTISTVGRASANVRISKDY